MPDNDNDKIKKSESGLLSEASDLCSRLREKLSEKVECASPTLPINKRLPFKTQMIKTALAYRMVDTSEVAINLLRQKTLIPGYIMVRSAFETSALLFMVYERVNKAVKSKVLGDIDDYLNRASIGGRSPSTPTAPDGTRIEAFNILTAIDKLSNKFKNLRDEFEFLCEFAHPNCPGTLLSYGRLEKEQTMYFFSFDAPYKTQNEPASYGLNVLLIALAIFIHYYEKMEDIFPEFQSLCKTT